MLKKKVNTETKEMKNNMSIRTHIIAITALIGVFMSCFTVGCNQKANDSNWKGNTDISRCIVDTAITRWPDGTIKTIKIKHWRGYQGEQILITDYSDNMYLLNSFNTVLIGKNQ